jgi:hypothetical protein
MLLTDNVSGHIHVVTVGLEKETLLHLLKVFKLAAIA